MKIGFKRRRLYWNLIIGVLWTVLGIIVLLEAENIRWLQYGYLVIGLLIIGRFLFYLTHQYLIIENGTIRKHVLYRFGKEMSFDEINSIEKVAGDYTLRAGTTEMKIKMGLFEENSRVELTRILDELNLPS